MSADNWTQCPKCKADRLKAEADAREKARAAYGKVSADEFERLRLRASPSTIPQADTMREDYDIGTDEDGNFTVSYTCSCTVCAFRWRYEHSEAVKVPV